MGETPQVYVQDLAHEGCQGIKKCTIEHEETHLNDALKDNKDICKGNSGRVIIVDPNEKTRLESEERAFEKEIECLKREREGISIPECKSRYNSKINGVRWQLENKVKKGNYP